MKTRRYQHSDRVEYDWRLAGRHWVLTKTGWRPGFFSYRCNGICQWEVSR